MTVFLGLMAGLFFVVAVIGIFSYLAFLAESFKH